MLCITLIGAAAHVATIVGATASTSTPVVGPCHNSPSSSCDHSSLFPRTSSSSSSSSWRGRLRAATSSAVSLSSSLSAGSSSISGNGGRLDIRNRNPFAATFRSSSSNNNNWASSCCFSHPPTTSSASIRTTTTSTSSPVIASLFFKNLWTRRLPRMTLPRAGGIFHPVVKDSTPSFFDTLSLERDQEQHVDNVVGGENLLHRSLPSTQVDASQLNANNAAVSAAATTNNADNANNANPEAAAERKILLHTYSHQNATIENSAIFLNDVHNNKNLTLLGVGMHKRQFAAWVHYYLLHMTEDGEVNQAAASAAAATSQHKIGESEEQANLEQLNKQRELGGEALDQISQYISTQEVDYETDWEAHVPTIRQSWKEGRLICEHTNLLNARKKHHEHASNQQQPSNNSNNGEGNLSEEQRKLNREEEERQYRQEQFRDVLGSYAERLASIVEDELTEGSEDYYSTSLADHLNGDGSGGSSSSLRQHNFAQMVDLSNNGKKDSSSTGHDGGVPIQQQQAQHTLPKWTTPNGLRGWIEQEYGVENTRLLLAETLLQKSEEEQLQTFQSFLDWFRSEFPYFHDKCDSCRASCKDDPVPPHPEEEMKGDVDTNIKVDLHSHAAEGSANTLNSGEQTDEVNGEEAEDTLANIEGDDYDDFSFLGYVYPSPTERLGNASRTELYRCRSCSSCTRFPRYNRALWVTSSRRGRCGEYSMLLYRMLRVLGYDGVRWVVDWADHVWAEVWLGDEARSNAGSSGSGGRWIHLDPCEAAVDNPLLYESWGKNQTYIVAFHDPFHVGTGHENVPGTVLNQMRNGTAEMTMCASEGMVEATSSPAKTSLGLLEHKKENRSSQRLPPVEDITHQYTTDETEVIEERRGIANKTVVDAIAEVSRDMVESLRGMTRR